MMFTLKWTKDAKEQYDKLKSKAEARRDARLKKGKTKSTQAEGLFKQVAKTINLLKSNPKHPGLNTHEYDSIPNPYDENKKVFEAYAQNNTPGAYRVFWCYGPDQNEMTIITITPHP